MTKCLTDFNSAPLPSSPPPREMHPPVECRGAPFAATAGLDPHRVSHSLDDVAHTGFLLDEEPRKLSAGRLGLAFRPVVSSCLFVAHDTFLLACDQLSFIA